MGLSVSSPTIDTRVATWALDEPCKWLNVAEFSELVVQFDGAFSGATVELFGTNSTAYDGVVLTGQHGTPISLSRPAIRGVAKSPLYVRPVAHGDASGVTVILLCRRGLPTKG